MTTCKGCNRKTSKAEAALSRYGHGHICSDCGMTEAFHGNFIARYASKVDDTRGVYPLDLLQADNITA